MKKGTLQRKSKSGRYTILKKIMVSILICCLLLQLPVFPAYAVSSTPLQTNGQLKVKGTKIVNEYAAQSSAPVISQPVCARLPAHIPVTDKITIPAMKFSAKRYSP